VKLFLALFLAAGCSVEFQERLSTSYCPEALTPAQATTATPEQLKPFATSYPVDLSYDYNDPYAQMYFAHPRPVTLAVTVHNPGPKAQAVRVHCRGNAWDGKNAVRVIVPGYSERHFLATVSSTVMVDACRVVDTPFNGQPIDF
jgi:hypothetical protein